jgi:hypothetical protein
MKREKNYKFGQALFNKLGEINKDEDKCCRTQFHSALGIVLGLLPNPPAGNDMDRFTVSFFADTVPQTLRKHRDG